MGHGGKREDGFKQSKSSHLKPKKTTEVEHIDTLCASVEAGHAEVTRRFIWRLCRLQALRSPWASGEAAWLAATLWTSRDDAVVFGVLHRLRKCMKPLSPRSLDWLLPLAQRLAQSQCEDHAISATLFILQELQVAWPTVAETLQSATTPKATQEACEQALNRLSSLLHVVKATLLSVPSSQTSAPLVPPCQKLKASLEEALFAVGQCHVGVTAPCQALNHRSVYIGELPNS